MQSLRKIAIMSVVKYGSSVRIPLCHMEYMEGPDGSWAFRETGPLPSPQLKVKMQLDTDAYF